MQLAGWNIVLMERSTRTLWLGGNKFWQQRKVAESITFTVIVEADKKCQKLDPEARKNLASGSLA